MVEGKIVQLTNQKKYYVHDIVKYLGNTYLYLIEVNETAENFENNAIILKEKINNGSYSLVELSQEELNELKKYF